MAFNNNNNNICAVRTRNKVQGSVYRNLVALDNQGCTGKRKEEERGDKNEKAKKPSVKRCDYYYYFFGSEIICVFQVFIVV